jgi:hypothetical protein
MKRSGVFWGLVLLVIGGLFLLGNFGFLGNLRVNLWQLAWPVFLILLGLWVVLGATGVLGHPEVERVSLPLEGIQSAHVRIKHGVGATRLAGSAQPGALLSGAFSGGLNYRAERQGAAVRLKMDMPDIGPFFPWGSEVRWDFGLSGEIPLALNVDGGAGILELDMTDLRVTDLKVDGGVGTSTIRLPRSGRLTVKAEGGVGTMMVYVPEGLAARIKTKSGLGGTTIDQRRFPLAGENLYISPGYDTAENRVDMTLEVGVGSITVR